MLIGLHVSYAHAHLYKNGNKTSQGNLGRGCIVKMLYWNMYVFSRLSYSDVMDWFVTARCFALTATLKDHLVGTITIVDYMLFWLNRHAEFQ